MSGVVNLCDKTDFKNADEFKDEIKTICSNGKQNILFYSVHSLQITGNSTEEDSLGETETMLILLAKGLSDEYNVLVVCSCPKSGIYKDVIYLDVTETTILTDINFETAVVYKLIPFKFVINLKESVNINKLIFWSQDHPMDYDLDVGITKGIDLFDKIVCISVDHLNAFGARFPLCLDEDKFVSIVHDAEFVKNWKNLLKDVS